MGQVLLNLIENGEIYLIIYLFLFLLAVLENTRDLYRYRYWISYVLCLLLALFTGMRWETGTDWDAYKLLFDSIKFDWTFLMNVYGFDIGYVLFNAIIRMLTSNYTVFLIVDSLLAMGILCVFLSKYSNYPILSLYVFYNAFFVAQFMGSNRRIIAMGALLFFFTAVFFTNRRVQIFSFLMSFIFHRSSLVGLCVYFLPKKRFSIRASSFFILISLIVGITQSPFKLILTLAEGLSSLAGNPLVEKILFYSEHGKEQLPEEFDSVTQMILSVVKRCVFLSFYFWLIYKSKWSLDPVTDFFFNIYILGFVMYLLLNGTSTFMMMSTYFTFIEVALLGRMWAYAAKDERFIFLSVLLVYGVFQLTSAVSAFPSLYLPYKVA